jgi:exonuclease III
LFNNIDGNAFNFDYLVSDLSQYKERFDIITLAETNDLEEHKDLYQMNRYNSEYSSKAQGKKKGSGLAIYIKNELQFTRMEKFCRQTENI